MDSLFSKKLAAAIAFFLAIPSDIFLTWEIWNFERYKVSEFALIFTLVMVAMLILSALGIALSTNEKFKNKVLIVYPIFVLIHQTLVGFSTTFRMGKVGEGLFELMLSGFAYLGAFIPTVIIVIKIIVMLLNGEKSRSYYNALGDLGFLALFSLGLVLAIASYGYGVSGFSMLCPYTFMAIGFLFLTKVKKTQIREVPFSHNEFEERIVPQPTESQVVESKSNEIENKIDYYNSIK